MGAPSQTKAREMKGRSMVTSLRGKEAGRRTRRCSRRAAMSFQQEAQASAIARHEGSHLSGQRDRKVQGRGRCRTQRLGSGGV